MGGASTEPVEGESRNANSCSSRVFGNTKSYVFCPPTEGKAVNRGERVLFQLGNGVYPSRNIFGMTGATKLNWEDIMRAFQKNGSRKKPTPRPRPLQPWSMTPGTSTPQDFRDWMRDLENMAPFDFNIKYCGGSIWFEGFECCANRHLYQPETHGCCGNRVYPLSPKEWVCCVGQFLGRGDSCCFALPYFSAEELCCPAITIRNPGTLVIHQLTPRNPSWSDSAECCSFTGLAYDPVSQTCCEGHPYGAFGIGAIHNIHDADCCCEDVLNTGEVCCDPIELGLSDSVCHKGPGNACCSVLPFDNNRQLCCEGVLFEGAHPQDYECCGNMAISKATQLCCPGDVYHDIPDPAASDHYLCCGSSLMDSRIQFCCNGHTRTVPSATASDKRFYDCCGDALFDKRQQLCCTGETVRTIPSGSRLQDYTCCNRALRHKPSQGCCQSNLYNYASHVCCNGRVGAGDSCCGGTAYDRSKCKCCDTSREEVDCYAVASRRCFKAGSNCKVKNVTPFCHMWVRIEDFDEVVLFNLSPGEESNVFHLACGEVAAITAYQWKDASETGPSANNWLQYKELTGMCFHEVVNIIEPLDPWTQVCWQ